MKKMKKFVALFLTLTLLTLLFTGCKKSESTTTKEEAVAVTEETKNEVDSNSNAEGATEVANNKEELEEGIIKVLYGSGLCGIPLHIAKQLEFFEAEGLVEGVDYEYVTSSTPGVEMLSTKQADVSFGLVAAMLAPLDNGLEAKTVLGIHTGCIQIIASTDSDIKGVADLKGKKIGVTQLASSDHIVTQRALASEGIGSTADNMEVEFIVYDKDNLPIALKEGAVDAIAIGDPKATILINEGAGISIFDSATSELLKDEYCCALWARNETIEKQPKKLAKVVSAIQKASAWIDQNKELAAEIQLDNEWLVGDLDIDIAAIEHFKYLPSVSGVEEALTRNILDMKDLGLIKKDTDADQLARTSFARLEGVEDEITSTVEAPIDPATQVKAN
ncbi:MAG: transporter substrate-binding protein [Anaerocolumna sp.]|jgi:NitT/TauT family transport system substrate-binding protein|nr:transporter substrate-binding protein [Anaerocolumna sp.]